MWREKTRASPGLLLFLDGLLEKKPDLRCLIQVEEERGLGWLQSSGLGDGVGGQVGVKKGSVFYKKPRIFASEACALLTISSTRTALQAQSVFLISRSCVCDLTSTL